MSLLLAEEYRNLKDLASRALGNPSVAELIGEMAIRARQFLERCERVSLTSGVRGKNYFGFRAKEQSRPINQDLYIQDSNFFDQLLESFLSGLPNAAPNDISKITYTLSNCVFATHDVHGVGRKASATFFEILIGHLIARSLGVSPRKKVRVPESQAELPTDYVFDLGPNNRKLHLPIKTSTRERAVQAWVHQLVLERIFGTGEYRGVLVVCGETKRNVKTGVVTEICVPKQLQMFQARVAELSRIYYLDAPQAYLNLSASFPRVDVRSFGEALQDIVTLLHA